MPKISDIKKQVKRTDRYSIYIDGKYVFSFGETELLNSGLRINQELNQEELEGLKDTAVIDKGYDRALNLISMRPRSEWEIQDYLKRKDYDEETSRTVLEKLKNMLLLDDLKFARAWVENRRLLKATSKRRLQQELRQKRVADDIIQQVLEEDETDELDVLRQLVEKKKSRYPDKMKLMQYLSRQGFSYSDIKSVLDEG